MTTGPQGAPHDLTVRTEAAARGAARRGPPRRRLPRRDRGRPRPACPPRWRQLESAAYRAGVGGYRAPGQWVGDFLAARTSTAFGCVLSSYKPGVTLGDWAPVLPAYAV
ncbi:MAG: FAD-dependent protein [Tepidimonas sp.]|uniref:FAD-dependent protein n=1 Tax=Tepidimonas sp. TaxID=2002775 RepID=UPI0040550AA5